MIKMNELNYTILPGRFCLDEHIDLFERAFNFYEAGWSAVFKDLKTDAVPSADNFFKQDFVPVITHNGAIVAIHLYSLYDLRPQCSLRNSYLEHNFNSEFFAKLGVRNMKKVMSMESLFVNPEYRRSKSGFPFMEILIALGQRVFAELTDASSIIAPARLDLNVAQAGYPLGFEIIVPEIQLNNVPVQLLICEKQNIKPPPTDSSRLLVESLWSRKVISAPNVSQRKVA